MCGSTPQENEISDEQQQFYKQMADEFSTIFGQNQAITGALTSAFTPILNAGPSQQGYSAQENTSLNTQNTEGVATDYAQAQKATAQILAARGGGNTMLPSSVTSNILAQNTNAAAATRAQGANTILQNNYAQGYQNWNTAANVLGNTAGLLNPNAYASSATSAGTAASNTANQIAQNNFAPWGAVAGAAGSVLGAALNPISPIAKGIGTAIGNVCWIAAELYGGWQEPRTVLIRRWLIENFTGHWLLNLYVRYGERTAGIIRRHRPVRWIFMRLFNQFLRLASAQPGEE